MRFPSLLPSTARSSAGRKRSARWHTNLARRKNGSTDSFSFLTKGQLVEINGWVKPVEYVDKTGTRHHRIVFAVSKVTVVEPEEKKAEGE